MGSGAADLYWCHSEAPDAAEANAGVVATRTGERAAVADC
jgi:hypothetical protein